MSKHPGQNSKAKSMETSKIRVGAKEVLTESLVK